jgi:hypothetical protein
MPTICVDLTFVNEYTLDKLFSFIDENTMPRSSRTSSRKRPARKSPRRVLRDMRSMLLQIEAPLNDAIQYVQALRMIGSGLIGEYDDDGEPIVAVARAAAERLEAVKEIWNGIHEAGA